MWGNALVYTANARIQELTAQADRNRRSRSNQVW